MENLEKGVKASLVKQDSQSVLRFGAGWDVNKGNSSAFDIDLAAYIFDENNNKLAMLYFNNKQTHGMTHSGDNLTGAGEGEDEFFKFDVKAIDPKVKSVYIAANVYDASSRRQNFGMINNCFVQATDETNNTPLAKLDLSEDFSGFTGVVLGKIYRHNDEWKFQAIGQGVNGSLNDIAEEIKKLF